MKNEENNNGVAEESASRVKTEEDDPRSAEDRLERVRADINTTDAQLLALLNRRAALSVAAGKIKAQNDSPIFRPGREEAVLERLAAANKGPLPNDHLRAVYREILSSSRALQRSLRVAFLGPEGTFSHMACLEYFGRGFTGAPMQRMDAVFAAVEKRDCDLGIVPVENSVYGTVAQSFDLFVTHSVHVQAEWFSRIRLCLISRENSLTAVRRVYSHPQPLGQCSGWLKENLPHAEQISMESSVFAAERAAGENGGAAVCRPGMGERLNLNTLASGIEDLPDNLTRFFVIGSAPAGERRTSSAPLKSSVLFIIPDKPGSLAAVLQSFFKAGINLSKLESRPMRGESWKYIFFADLDCDINAPLYAGLLETLRRTCLQVRILGSYHSGRHIRPPE
ncbi:MAG: prephenate dehydratase [Desulfovibrio sp.]|nr:prephenate dehydratase [Desulfovibrio sp.]